ncbi:hypothetical protein DIURU_000113 [Diutina rugosa]|uniref:PH-response regulator protein palI/RIM9 n=1 Tax=Diutina rugosa TaxID=5481 RepID=A0A642V5Z8_DIURU|nr:uncharacterized protein DIURU_000113 [Diutina rugosa]KAA8908570.1 hypothetical protein DIURU_000113 [Diutina rugosa]
MIGFHTVALVLLLAAFVFTLLASISGPVASTLVLAEASGVKYGIFGYTSSSQHFQGYPIHFSDVTNQPRDWVLSQDQRTNCAKAFVIAPIACGFSFFAVVGYLIGHFVWVGRIIGLVLNVIAALCSIAICVLVVLVFHPHVSAIGWLTVAAAGCALIAIIPGLLSLFLGTRKDADDRDDTSSYDENSNSYDGQKLDDKFGHVHTNVISLPHTNHNDNRSFAYQPKPQAVARPGNVAAVNGQPKYSTESKLTNKSSVDSTGATQPPVAPATVVPQSAPRVTPTAPYGQQQASRVTPGAAYGQSTQFSHNQAVQNAQPGVGASAPISRSTVGGANQAATTGTTPYPTGSWGPQQAQPQPRPLSDSDEFDDEDNLGGAGHGGYPSDSDSDFTSVSQRAPNPNYEQPPAPPPHRGVVPGAGGPGVVPSAFAQNQSFHQQQSPGRMPGQPYHGQLQPQRPTVSEQALSSNPDFGFPQARRRQAGFVPVAARYKPQAAGRPPAANRPGYY